MKYFCCCSDEGNSFGSLLCSAKGDEQEKKSYSSLMENKLFCQEEIITDTTTLSATSLTQNKPQLGTFFLLGKLAAAHRDVDITTCHHF